MNLLGVLEEKSEKIIFRGKTIWQCVKTLYPCSSHQNSWDLWMFIPLKMVFIGIDPYPHARFFLVMVYVLLKSAQFDR